MRAVVPQSPDVMALVKDYKGEEAVAQGEDFDPSPDNIEKRTEKTATAGSIKQALLTKKTRGNVVAARLTFRFGDVNSLKNKGAAPSLTADMLNKGTKSKTRQEISDAFNKLNARVGIGGGLNQVNVSVETTRDNLPAVIKLIAE